MARTSTDIQADIDALIAARSALIANHRVTEIWRDGRRLTYERMSFKDIQTALDGLYRELKAAQAEEDGRPRRRAIGIVYGN